MDPDLYDAAVEGNFQPFEGRDPHDLPQIVTDFKDTILHIHIKLQKISGPESSEFVGKILGKCPSLLFQTNMIGDTPLHVAAKGNCSDIVKVLIEGAKQQPNDPETTLRADCHMLRMTNDEYNTALHEAVIYTAWREAVIYGRSKVVEILSKADLDFPYFSNKYGETPLYLAAAKGKEGMVKAILEGCSWAAHEGPNGMTALHAAVLLPPFWSKGTIEYLLEKKNLTKATDQYGWTPLQYAAYNGRYYAAKLLLAKDKSAAYIVDKDRKMTALHMAASQGYQRIVKEIISQCPECCEMVDDRGWNFLHFAVLTFEKKELCDLLESPLVASLRDKKDGNGNVPSLVSAAAYRFNSPLSVPSNVVNHKNVYGPDIMESGYPDLEKEIQVLLEDVGKGGQYHRGVICKRMEKDYYKNKMEQRRKYEEGLKKTAESNSVVATLIATVTFAAAFTVPGGYNSEKNDIHEGTAVLIRNSAFQAFIIMDALALTLSLSSVFIHFIMSFEKIVDRHGNLVIVAYEKLFNLASCLTMLAIVAVVVAFVTGLYAVLVPSLWLAITTCCIGLSFLLLVFAAVNIFGSYLLQRQRGKSEILEETFRQNLFSRFRRW